jgi:hypothetical protein
MTNGPEVALRLCAANGCDMYGKHYENCPECWGFGMTATGVPANSRYAGDGCPCRRCHSTTSGAPRQSSRELIHRIAELCRSPRAP